MAILVAPGVCRFAVNGTYSGQEVVNIIDMHMEGNFLGDARSESNFNQAGVLINQWAGDVMPNLSNQYAFRSVSWMDLDTAAGETGERSTTGSVNLPVNGSGTSGSLPGNVAVRINKNVTSKRGQRQGRMYLVGMSEGATTTDKPNEMNPEQRANMTGVMGNFLTNLNQEPSSVPGSGGEYKSTMVVVHTKDGVFTNFSNVQGLTCDSYLASQVRRLRR